MAPAESGPPDPERLGNPFWHMSDRRRDDIAKEIVHMYSRAGKFYRLKKYEDTLIKAARILRDPRDWRSIRTDDVGPLTLAEQADLERDAIEARDHGRTQLFWRLSYWRKDTEPKDDGSVQNHPSGFWRTPKELRTTIMTLCTAAVVQGWVQISINGANLTWLKGTGLIDPGDVGCDPEGRIAWIFAIVNAAPWFSAAIFALLVTDPATEILFGRRAAIVMAGIFTLAASVGGALVSNWWQLLICRILLGLGMGCKASVVAVFAAEVAPARMRGSLVMNWQLFDTFGIVLGFSANLMVSPLGENSWRWMTACPAFPTIVLLALVLIACPESPRFLMSRGHYLDAYETLTRLRGSRILAAKELVYSHYQLQFEQDQGISRPRGSRSTSVHSEVSERDIGPRNRITFLQKLAQLFSVRRNRNALVTAVICMISQQMCGVNVLIFYSATIYSDVVGAICSHVTPASLRPPLLMSWGIGLTNFIFSFPAYWMIDTKGRRWLLMTTVPFLCIFMAAASLSYVNGGHPIALGLFTYLFVAFYSWGMGPVPFTIAAEVFSLEHRVVGMSVAVFTNFFGAGLLTLFVPAITASSLGHGGLLGIFAFLNVVCFVLISYFVRETIGAADENNPNRMEPFALEDLFKIFDLRTSEVLKYQTINVVPQSIAWFAWWCWPFSSKEKEPLKPEGLVHIWERNNRQFVELIENGGEKPEPDDGVDHIERVDRAPAREQQD